MVCWRNRAGVCFRGDRDELTFGEFAGGYTVGRVVQSSQKAIEGGWRMSLVTEMVQAERRGIGDGAGGQPDNLHGILL